MIVKDRSETVIIAMFEPVDLAVPQVRGILWTFLELFFGLSPCFSHSGFYAMCSVNFFAGRNNVLIILTFRLWQVQCFVYIIRAS